MRCQRIELAQNGGTRGFVVLCWRCKKLCFVLIISQRKSHRALVKYSEMSYRVYFGRLPETLSQDDFEKLIEEHGKAKNIEWKSGYAYVDYKHGSDASNTVKNLNGKEIGGNNILVELAQNGMGGYSIAGGFSARMKAPLPRPVRTPHRVRIENLSSRAKWMELKELLSLAGEVTFADTHKRKQGEGIVEFADRRSLNEAINMFDRTSFFGKTIRIFNESPRSKSRSRSPRRQSSPGHRGKRDKRSRSGSPKRKKSPLKRRSESRKNSSRSPSPQKKSRKHKRSKSRSASPSPRKRRSRTPTKSSKHSLKKSKKSKRDHSRSKSPRRKKKDKRSEKHKHKKSDSSSGSDSDMSPKKKTKTVKKKQHSSDSESGSSSSKDSKSDN